MSERLHKVLAGHGLGSRREVERWILDGRVLLNGAIAKVGDLYQPGDRVKVDGKEITGRLRAQSPLQVLLYHKPQGQPLSQNLARADRAPDSSSSKSDSEFDDDAMPASRTKAIQESVQDRLPATRGSRWIPINPMHAGDSGLLLATNDGNLDYALTRRKRWISSAYMVRVLAPGAALTPPELPLEVSYDDNVVEFTKVEAAGGEGANLWYRVELSRADRRAAVRALFEAHGLKVNRMTQVMFGGIELPRDLPRMRHRELNAEQVASLYALARIPQPAPIDPKAQREQRAPRDGKVRGKNARNNKLRGPAPDRRKPKRKRT